IARAAPVVASKICTPGFVKDRICRAMPVESMSRMRCSPRSCTRDAMPIERGFWPRKYPHWPTNPGSRSPPFSSMAFHRPSSSGVAKASSVAIRKYAGVRSRLIVFFGTRREPSLGEAHGFRVCRANLSGLTGRKHVVAQLTACQRMLGQLVQGQAFDKVFPIGDRQIDTTVELGIANRRLGVFAAGDCVNILQKALAHHDNAGVACPQMLVRAVGNHSLPYPGDEILIHDVARDQASGVRVENRAAPRRDLLLHIRLSAL